MEMHEGAWRIGWVCGGVVIYMNGSNVIGIFITCMTNQSWLVLDWACILRAI